MNYVESVQIFGFWGDRHVEVKFNKDLNFLIGKNGTGKTTIINLISAAMRADISVLYSISFSKLIITLKSHGANKKPIIEIVKSVNDATGGVTLTFTIRERTTDKGAIYVVDSPFDGRVYREPRSIRTKRLVEVGAKLGGVLSALVEVNWLSVHRNSIDKFARFPREEEFDSSIDQKISELSGKFSSYFSLLSSQANEENKQFQEQVFLSFIEERHSFFERIASSEDDPEEKTALISALRDLGVSNSKATKSVSSHFTRLERARKAYHDSNALTLETIGTLSDSARLRQIVNRWRELVVRRNEIFKPRASFEQIINTLFTGKELHFDQRNNPKIQITRSRKMEEVDVDALSSGEKQLFILLGEALLQEGRPVVFISDEPELSLHVDWQAVLFENVRKLNPSCQIICATHSPDIVGPFSDRVIHAESCFVDV